MSKLTNLIALDLSNNNIEYLFDDIDCLINLRQINLLKTKIVKLPDNFPSISKNCELIINSESILNNLPFDIEYITINYINTINLELILQNLPCGLKIIYMWQNKY